MIFTVVRTSPSGRAVDRSGFTFLEMLTTIAALVIVLGLAVSLARHVRTHSGQQLTRDLLRTLDRAVARYVSSTGSPIATAPFIAAAPGNRVGNGRPIRTIMLETARLNNEQFMRLLLRQDGPGSTTFPDLPISTFDPKVPALRDAWGTPIVMVGGTGSAIGLAPGGNYFFVSAGPDRDFLTLDDNLYSYDLAPAAQTSSSKDR